MDNRVRNALWSIAALFGVLLIAYVAGQATRSEGVFVAVLAIGIAIHFAVRQYLRHRR